MPKAAAQSAGKGPYIGRPRHEKAADGHVSAAARFMDSGFHTVPWTADLALRAARTSSDRPRDERLEALALAVDRGDLPPEAIAALVAAGYPELD